MSYKMEQKTTADPQLEDNFMYGQPNGSTFIIKRSPFQKLKDLFLGTATLQTNAQDVSNAINELNTSLTELAKHPYCRVHNSTTQSVAPGVSALAFNTEDFDTDNMHDNTTNNSRLTCKTAGKYLIMGSIDFSTNPSGSYRSGLIKLNGTTFIEQTLNAVVTSAETTILQVSAVCNMSANDYVELISYHNASGSLSVNSKFTMIKVG